jgi:hypothetical protein
MEQSGRGVATVSGFPSPECPISQIRAVPGTEARLLQRARYGSIVRSGIVEPGFPLSDVR